MYDAPGTVREINPATRYESLVLDALDGYFTPAEIEALKAEIKNSTQLTKEQIDALLAEFPAVQNTEPHQAVNKADWHTNFMQWYKDNLIVISLVQWAFIIILLIRKSN